MQLITLGMCNNVLAAEDCSKALVLTSTTYLLDETTLLSVAWNLSEEQYNEAKSKAGLNVVIYDVPVGASYSDFRQNILKKAQSYKLEDFEKRSIAYATRSLDANGLAAYKACLVGNHVPTLVVEEIGTNNYRLYFVYDPAPGAGSFKWNLGIVDNLANASARDLKSLIASLPAGKAIDQPFTVKPTNADSEVAINLVATGGGFGASAILPPLHVNLPPAPAVPLTQRVFEGAPASVLIDGDACAKSDFGTLLCGYNYLAQYNNQANSWSVTGFNRDTHGVGTWVYSNAPNGPGNMSMWGKLFTFNNDGIVFAEAVKVGLITVVQPSGGAGHIRIRSHLPSYRLVNPFGSSGPAGGNR
jgi:hypothetical protein